MKVYQKEIIRFLISSRIAQLRIIRSCLTTQFAIDAIDGEIAELTDILKVL